MPRYMYPTFYTLSYNPEVGCIIRTVDSAPSIPEEFTGSGNGEVFVPPLLLEREGLCGLYACCMVIEGAVKVCTSR
jgi:hypothetical protein